MLTANRYHDIDCGHRVVGHEGKCSHIHGHGYRVHFYCQADQLDSVGRVIDFSVIKEKLCMWLEDEWDHRFLAWEKDDMIRGIYQLIPGKLQFGDAKLFQNSIVWTPFNPTAENMAQYLVDVIGPQQLEGTGVKLVKVIIEETRKCSVTCEVKNES